MQLFVILGWSLLASLPFSAQAAGPATIAIAAWDIEQFGGEKLTDPVILGRIAEVIKEFDVIAIQEITHFSSQGHAVVNSLTRKIRTEYRRTYGRILGPRTGCQAGRVEQYAVLYDSDLLQEVKTRIMVDDPGEKDNMCRDPLVVTLRMKDKDAKFSFTLVVVHTIANPGSALKEDLNALGRIFQAVQDSDAEEDDVILLGGLHANPRNFKGLEKVDDLVYAIPDHSTMTTSIRQNDNILFQWASTGEDYTGHAGVFPLASFLEISPEEANQLSDHLPVYAVFFTRRDTQ